MTCDYRVVRVNLLQGYKRCGNAAPYCYGFFHYCSMHINDVRRMNKESK